MLRNINNIRQRFNARGFSVRSAQKVSTAMARRAKYSKSSDVEQSSILNQDRFSNTLSGTEQTASSASLGECRVNAAKSVYTLTKTCSSFDSAMSKNLAEAGVPQSVSFSFDYDISSGEAKITDISDEKYLNGVKSALSKAMKSVDLDSLAGGSMILNGKMTEVYYPKVAKALEKSFGQDISELSVDKNGNILGMNRNMRAAVSYELADSSFDARSRYGFPAKQFASVVKSVISDKPEGGSVSHMSFRQGSLETADGSVKLGSKCASPSLKDTGMMLRAAAAGSPSSMDLWVQYGDLF